MKDAVRAVYKARWVDAFGPDGTIATDEVLAAAALGPLVSRMRAGLKFISPDDITPMGQRMLEKILDEAEG